MNKKIYFFFPILFTFITLSAGSSHAQGDVEIQATVDNENPVINIIAPPDGATISGNEEVNITVTDDGGIVKVEFFVDGLLKLTDTSDPFEFTLDTRTVSDGSHTISVTATDIDGKTDTDIITVIVDNSIPQSPSKITTPTGPVTTEKGPSEKPEEERKLLIFPGLESIRLFEAPLDFVTANSNFFYGFLFALELLILYWIIKKLRERKNKDK